MVWILKRIWRLQYNVKQKRQDTTFDTLGCYMGSGDIPESQVFTILGIIGIVSIPFVMLAVVWMLKPELAT